MFSWIPAFAGMTERKGGNGGGKDKNDGKRSGYDRGRNENHGKDR